MESFPLLTGFEGEATRRLNWGLPDAVAAAERRQRRIR